MVIVAGYLLVAPGEREKYLTDCAEVVTSDDQATAILDASVGEYEVGDSGTPVTG